MLQRYAFFTFKWQVETAKSDIMWETSLITATRDHFDRRERRMRTHFILPPDARNNSIHDHFTVKITICVTSLSRLSNRNIWNLIL